MNKETIKILTYIQNSENYKKKVKNLYKRNSKDFSNQVLYVIMEIVSTEKKFFGMDRSKIDINAISQELFI